MPPPAGDAHGGVFWLAWYPKSGNTWMRISLSNLTGEAAQPVAVNSPHGSEIESSRARLDHLLAFDTADLMPGEVELLRAGHAWQPRGRPAGAARKP